MSNDPSAIFVALAVVLLLGLALRWIFKPSHPRVGARGLIDASESSAAGNLGMLDVVVPGIPRARALTVRNTLTEAGIRSSISRRNDGAVDVLVFRDDADRARDLLRI